MCEYKDLIKQHFIFQINVRKGKALLINNEFFADPAKDRRGSSVDVTNLKMLWNQLGFRVGNSKSDSCIKQETILPNFVKLIFFLFLLITLTVL